MHLLLINWLTVLEGLHLPCSIDWVMDGWFEASKKGSVLCKWQRNPVPLKGKKGDQCDWKVDNEVDLSGWKSTNGNEVNGWVVVHFLGVTISKGGSAFYQTTFGWSKQLSLATEMRPHPSGGELSLIRGRCFVSTTWWFALLNTKCPNSTGIPHPEVVSTIAYVIFTVLVVLIL